MVTYSIFENFKYMFTLLLCFLIQFIIACVCLGIISENSQTALLEVAWNKLDTETIRETQIKNSCCGFAQMNSTRVECPNTANKPCVQIVRDSVAQALKTTGIVGLLFSFINVIIPFLFTRFKSNQFKTNFCSFSCSVYFWLKGSETCVIQNVIQTHIYEELIFLL